MSNLNFMFFGSLMGTVNRVVLVEAINNLASLSEKYAVSREFCLDMYELLDDLKEDLLDFNIKIGNIDYTKNAEYKFPILDKGRKVAIATIDSRGKCKIFYDAFQADFDAPGLEVKIESLLQTSKMELIDAAITMLQFARPIPISSESFLLSISREEKEDIRQFFKEALNKEASTDPGQLPYFLALEETEENLEEVSNLLVERMDMVLKAFSESKEEYYSGFSENLDYEDIELINNLIEFTLDDAYFYEEEIGHNIIERLKSLTRLYPG